jgi:hypothetical protein
VLVSVTCSPSSCRTSGRFLTGGEPVRTVRAYPGVPTRKPLLTFGRNSGQTEWAWGAWYRGRRNSPVVHRMRLGRIDNPSACKTPPSLHCGLYGSWLLDHRQHCRHRLWVHFASQSIAGILTCLWPLLRNRAHGRGYLHLALGEPNGIRRNGRACLTTSRRPDIAHRCPRLIGGVSAEARVEQVNRRNSCRRVWP